MLGRTDDDDVVRCFIEATLKHSLLPEWAKAETIRRKTEKLREAKAGAWKGRLVASSCARVGRKDVVGGVKDLELMGVLVAGKGLSMSTPAWQHSTNLLIALASWKCRLGCSAWISGSLASRSWVTVTGHGAGEKS